MAPRGLGQRKLDALGKLRADRDLWIATSSPGGDPYLVPLSFAWDGTVVIIATQTTVPTIKNLQATGTARIALGGTRDVVLIDVALDQLVSAHQVPPGLAERYTSQAGWSPADEPGDYVYALLRPDRVQVWREVDEHPGRTIMRHGTWAN